VVINVSSLTSQYISDFCIQCRYYIVMCIAIAILEKGLTGAMVICEVWKSMIPL
jgi:hypothetical protein